MKSNLKDQNSLITTQGNVLAEQTIQKTESKFDGVSKFLIFFFIVSCLVFLYFFTGMILGGAWFPANLLLFPSLDVLDYLTIFQVASLTYVFVVICGVTILFVRKKWKQGIIFLFLFGLQLFTMIYLINSVNIIRCGKDCGAAPVPKVPLTGVSGYPSGHPIDVVVHSLMNSDGFVGGKKNTGSGDQTHSQSKVVIKSSFFKSDYIGKNAPYVVVREVSQGGVAGGSGILIVEPEQNLEQKNIDDWSFNYEINKVQGFNPWNAGSEITGGVDAVDYTLYYDHFLMVTFKVEKDVSFPNNEAKCIKRGEYRSTYILDINKHTYSPADRNDRLIESECLDRGQG